jgi:hypothetical protein
VPQTPRTSSGISIEGDISFCADVLISPGPALTVILKHNPDKVMLCPVINDDLGETFALWRNNWERWI